MLVSICLCASSVTGQPTTEIGTIEQRLGEGERDYERNKEVFNEWQKAKQKNRILLSNSSNNANIREWTMKDYHAWYYLRHHAPYCDFNLYSSGYGADMLLWLIAKEPDPAIKLTLFDDLMELSDLRISQLDNINEIAINDLKIAPSTMADVKCWKAYFYSQAGHSIPPKFYNPHHAYELWSDALFNTLRVQKSMQGTEIQGAFLMECFQTCTDVYKQDKQQHLEQYLQDYMSIIDACEKLYQSARFEKDTLRARQRFIEYFGPYQQISKVFQQSEAGLPENLESHFTAQFMTHKNDTSYLNNAIKLMIHNGVLPPLDASAHSVIEDYSEIAYTLHPTFYSALAWGLTLKKMAVTDTIHSNALRTQMHTVFEHGKKLAPDNQGKALMCYQLGLALNYPLDSISKRDLKKVQVWHSDLHGAIEQFQQAARLDSAHYAVCANWQLSSVMVKLGGTYAHGTHDNEQYQYLLSRIESFNEAMRYCHKVNHQAQIALNALEQQQMGYQMVDYMNWAVQRSESCQKSLNLLKRAQKKYDAAIRDINVKRSAYAAYIASKKKEEEFWRGGK